MKPPTYFIRNGQVLSLNAVCYIYLQPDICDNTEYHDNCKGQLKAGYHPNVNDLHVGCAWGAGKHIGAKCHYGEASCDAKGHSSRYLDE